MRILNALKYGASHSLKSWKNALIVWFVILALVALFALPVRGVMKAGFDSSMIVEKLKNGFDIEAFTDPGTAFKSIISFLKSAFLIIILAAFLLNAFLSGGLFGSVSFMNEKSGEGFWRNGAKNFWSFLVILSLIYIFIIALGLVIVIIPLALISSVEGQTELVIFRTGLITVSLFLLLLPVLLLVADYARAWQVMQEKMRCFSAIGFGFRQTFRTFFKSWPLMLIVLLIQVLYYSLITRFLPGITPSNAIGVFLFFIFSQVLFFFKILLKIFRYGSVTCLMETEIRKTYTEVHRGPQSYTETGF